MPRIPIVANHASIIESEKMVQNLAQLSLDEVVELRKFNSNDIGTWMSQFVVITTYVYKKDQWKITISGLFSKPCYDFGKIFKDYVTKCNG
jgi:hypothetical protein